MKQNPFSCLTNLFLILQSEKRPRKAAILSGSSLSRRTHCFHFPSIFICMCISNTQI